MSLSVILLASGNSRRFGGNKLLYEFKGRRCFCILWNVISTLETEGLW